MADFDWALPYASRREAVLARRAVATSQPLAVQAALHAMRDGGNAADAAITAAIALTVLEPTANGIGSDAFALVWAGGGLHGLNASGRSPAALPADRFIDGEISTRGWDGVTVPGAVSGWRALSERFGALPFERLFQPAIEYAREGFPVTRQNAGGWRRARRTYEGMEDFLRTFLPTGEGPEPGEIVRLPDHARTLEEIGATGAESFYRGAIAERIAAHARATGGWIDEGDLASHEARWVRPISIDYHGVTLHELPPNGQGLAALIMLGILAHHEIAAARVDSAESLHLQIEAMKLAFADGHRHIADPHAMEVEPAALLDPEYLAQRAAMIGPRAGDPGHGTPLQGGTVYLTAADAEGTMVSFIQSNYTGFGSGIVVPGTGIALQNRGCCFSVQPGHPNQVAPGKLPYHTIIPGFVTRNGEPLMSFGVMGGYMQPQGHAQVVIRLADYGQNPQAALDAPRWRVEEGRRVVIEPGFDAAVYEELRARGHEVELAEERTVAHGGGQAIYRLESGAWFAASDLRRDGQAAGY